MPEVNAEQKAQTVKVASSGMSFGTVLFLIFMTLKLTGVITWSWWFVTMPLWIGFVIFLGILVILGVGALALLGIMALIEAIKK